MATVSSGRDAKEYVIARIVDQAERDATPLSEIERKMMYFTETAWAPPDMWEVNEAFNRDYDQPTYEAKIGGLARRALDRSVGREEQRKWNEAVGTLRREDHYLLVLIDAGKRSTSSLLFDRVKLILTALLVVAVICVVIAFFSAR